MENRQNETPFEDSTPDATPVGFISSRHTRLEEIEKKSPSFPQTSVPGTVSP